MNDQIPTTTLGDLVSLQTDKIFAHKDPSLPYIGLEHIAQGSPRLVGISKSSDSVSVNAVFAENDILFGKLRPNLRKSLRARFSGYCSTDILVLRSRPGVLPAFAAHVFQWEKVFAAATATAVGTKMPRTSWSDLRNVRVFEPYSPAEQFRIASVLDFVDNAIVTSESLVEKLRQVRTGLLHEFLTCGVDEHNQRRDPITQPEHFKESIIGVVPREWDVMSLEQACDLIKDGTHLPPKRVDNGPLLLGVQNLVDDQLQCTEADTRVPLQFFEQMHRSWKIMPGDVLLAIVGATIGKVARVPHNFEPFTLQRSVALLRGKQGVLDNGFLELWLRGPNFQSAIRNASNQTAQPGLYLAQIANLRIPVLKLQEQCTISSGMSKIEATIRNEDYALSKLHALRTGLMNDLLTGLVRVPEDVEVGTNVHQATVTAY